MKIRKWSAIFLSLTLVVVGSFCVLASKEEAGGYSHVNEDGKIDIRAYFTTTDTKVNLQKESIDFVMTGKKATVAFDKPLAADSFGLSFAGVAGNTLEKVEIELIDVENPKEKASLIFSAMSESSSLIKVGNTERSFIINGSLFAENNYDFYAHYNGEYRSFTDDINYNIPVVESLDGTIFAGFSSHKVMVKVHLYGENGSVFRLKEINRQRLGNIYLEDTENPSITILNPISKVELGSTITLPKAFAMDVLADNATATLSVKDVDGETATAVDGTKLEDVAADKDYQIKIEKNGVYRVSYQATDGKNSTRPMTNPIVVNDNVGPEIQVSETIPVSAKVGEKITLPAVTYRDNISDETAISGWVTVKNPKGVVMDVEGSVELTEEGVYEFTFLAIDETGNMSRITMKTYAEGE